MPLICHLQTLAPPHLEASDWQLNASLKGVQHFISTSHQNQRAWIKVGLPQDKVEVVHNGTDTEIFKPADSFTAIRQHWQIPETTRVISYIGRLDEIKGVETLIKAFALLVRQNSDVDIRLLIAGSPVSPADAQTRDAYLRSLNQLPIDLGIDQHVQFLGHIAQPVSLYQVSDVTVLPSLFAEPFGRSVIESLACGIPVIGSQVGGIPEILTGELQPCLFEPGDEVDLAARLNAVLHWRSLHPQLGDYCRNHAVQHFSLNKTIHYY